MFVCVSEGKRNMKNKKNRGDAKSVKMKSSLFAALHESNYIKMLVLPKIIRRISNLTKIK